MTGPILCSSIRGAALVAGLALLSSNTFAQAPQTAPPQTPQITYTVDVIAATPLPGVDLLVEEIAAPVQTATDRDLEAIGAFGLSDFVNRRLNGVFVNEMQGNPFQPDVNYRGYTASPLLGTPQGLSIYMDGVRLNQPFGDIVSWDLIPRMAISSMALMPGSNPLFGLNTLGGALALQTKNGSSNPGTVVQLSYGSWVRRALEFQHGGSKASGLNWFLAGNLLGEDGWRQSSPSDIRQVFGKIGWLNPQTNAALSVGYANNSLTGNGPQEQRLLNSDYTSIYTKPDTTDNRATSVTFTIKHSVRPTVTFAGNGYYRDIRTDTLNGDLNEDSLDQSVYQPSAAERAALAAAGYTGVPASGATAENTPFPYFRCIGNVLLNDEPAEKCNGLLNRTHTQQHNYGTSGQLTFVSSPWGEHNQFTAGAGYDGNRAAFQQSTELGYLNSDRSVTGLNAFADGGITGGNVDGEPFDTRVDLDGHHQTWSIHGTDTVSRGARWRLTASARYNETRVHNSDRLIPGGGPGSLDGRFVFRRLNPAVGVTFDPVQSRSVNLYAGYGEGSRAPTSIELGCADVTQPCKLPNAMTGDPPLEQVIARTWEAGIRGGHRGMNWNAGWFFADNRNDILFVSSTQTGFGYFKNFGKTRRQGFEFGTNGRIGRVDVGGGYTYLSATYQSAETVNGTGNSTNDVAEAGAKGFDGTIDVVPGDRIPLIPRHMVKGFVGLQVVSKVRVNVDALGISSSYARGNENSRHQPDGTYYLGPGSSPGYAVVNIEGRYDVTGWFQLIGQIGNLLDQRYYTASQIGPVGFTSAGTFIARPLPAVNGEFPIQQGTFFAPGAPRRYSIGTRFKF